MTLNYTTIPTFLILAILIVVLIVALGFITGYRPLLSNNTKDKRKNKTQWFINKLSKVALCFIWLIGLSITLSVFGLTVNWFTFDTFLWGPFEMILMIGLIGLLIISMVIVHYAKEQRDCVRHHFHLLAKHLVAQITVIMIVALTFIIKFLILRE